MTKSMYYSMLFLTEVVLCEFFYLSGDKMLLKIVP